MLWRSVWGFSPSTCAVHCLLIHTRRISGFLVIPFFSSSVPFIFAFNLPVWILNGLVFPVLLFPFFSSFPEGEGRGLHHPQWFTAVPALPSGFLSAETAPDAESDFSPQGQRRTGLHRYTYKTYTQLHTKAITVILALLPFLITGELWALKF